VEEQQTIALAVRQLLALLRRWAWLVVLCAALGAGLAYGVSRRSAPVYEATAVLLVHEGQKPTGPDYDAVLVSERLVTTYAELLRGGPVLTEVAARLGLKDAGALGRMVDVQPVRDTQLLRLRVRHSSAEMAARLANTVCQVFIEQNARRQAARLTSAMEAVASQMNSLQKAMSDTEAQIEKVRGTQPTDSAELARLEAVLSQHRTNYSSLLQSYEELSMARASGGETISVIEPATQPGTPVAPRPVLNAVAAGLLGVVLAAGAALLSEHLNDTISSARDVARAVRLPTLATIGSWGARDGPEGPLMALRPGAQEGEGYRLLRAAVSAVLPATGRVGRVLLITSPMPCEGKTTTLANLGLALAQSGKRVVLVDANLRNPGLHRVFGLPQEPGLGTLLGAGEHELRSGALRETMVPGLKVLAAGQLPQSVAEVLDRPEMGALLRGLRSEADYVLVDSPAVLGLSDAAILAESADAVLLVVEARMTRLEALAHAVASLQPAGKRLLGVVLNRGTPPCSDAYYPGRRPASVSGDVGATKGVRGLVARWRRRREGPLQRPKDPNSGAAGGPAPGGPLPSRAAEGEQPSHRGQ